MAVPLMTECRREKLLLPLHSALFPPSFVRNSNLLNLSITNGLWMQLILLGWTRIHLHREPSQSASHTIKYKMKLPNNNVRCQTIMSSKESQDSSKEGKSSRKRICESRSMTDKEAGSCGHCCDASRERSEMHAKLDKLLEVFAEFEKNKMCVAALEEENEKLKEAAVSTAADILNLQTTAASMCHNMAATNNEVNSLKEEALNLR